MSQTMIAMNGRKLKRGSKRLYGQATDSPCWLVVTRVCSRVKGWPNHRWCEAYTVTVKGGIVRPHSL